MSRRQVARAWSRESGTASIDTRERSYRTPLVGRDEELAWLASAIEAGTRLVTLFGPPGVGKTRLAVEAFNDARAAGMDVIFCSLINARTRDHIAELMVAALGAPPKAHGSLEDAVVAQLSRRSSCLVVLDNFEHLTEVGSALVGNWVSRCSAVSFLVTSREILHLQGETSCELRPLEVPLSAEDIDRAPASRLLCQAIERYRARLDLDAEERRMVCEIVVRLEGLPLALEIVASSVALLGVRLCHQRLDELLGRDIAFGDGPVPARTLRETIGWSWDLLGEAEKLTLVSTATFRGGFTLEALEAVAGACGASPSDVLCSLASLREKSLVHVLPAQSRPRFGTYATIAEFARMKLDQLGLRDRAERRHRAYFAQLARELEESSSADAMEAMRLERANACVATQRAMVAGAADARDEIFSLLALLRRPLQPGDVPARTLGLLRWCLGRWAEDDVATGKVMLAEARILIHSMERFSEGHEVLEKVKALARAHGDGRLEARALIAASAAEPRGPHFALEQLREAAALARSISHPGILGDALVRMAFIHCNLGHFEHALDAAHEALALANDPVTLVHARSVAALAHAACGEVDIALKHSGDALNDVERWSLSTSEVGVYGMRATVLHLAGSLVEAEIFYRGAIERSAGERPASGAGFRSFMALVLFEQGQFEAARQEALAVEPLLDEVYDPVRPPALARAIAALARAPSGKLDQRAFVAPVGPAAKEVLKCLHMLAQLHATGGACAPAIRERVGLLRQNRGESSRPSSTVEQRIVERILERALAMKASSPTSSDLLIIHPEGEWMRIPNGSVVSLRQRTVLKGLLAALAKARVASVGTPVSCEELRDAGWPGEKMSKESARDRLKQSISVLRRLGLEQTLFRSKRGYFLSPSIPVTLSNDEKPLPSS